MTVTLMCVGFNALLTRFLTFATFPYKFNGFEYVSLGTVLVLLEYMIKVSCTAYTKVRSALSMDGKTRKISGALS